MVQLYPASTSFNMSSATLSNTMAWSAAGPKTLSNSNVLDSASSAPGAGPVNRDADDADAAGCNSSVICSPSREFMLVTSGDLSRCSFSDLIRHRTTTRMLTSAAAEWSSACDDLLLPLLLPAAPSPRLTMALGRLLSPIA